MCGNRFRCIPKYWLPYSRHFGYCLEYFIKNQSGMWSFYGKEGNERNLHTYPKYRYYHLVSWWVFCFHDMLKIKVPTSYDHWNSDSYQVNVLTWYKIDGFQISSRLILALRKKDNSSMKSPSACLRNTYGDVYSPNLGGSNALRYYLSLKYHLLARGNWRNICFRFFKKGTLKHTLKYFIQHL